MNLLEKRKIAVDLFMKYDKCATDVIKKPGYPNRKTLYNSRMLPGTREKPLSYNKSSGTSSS